MALKLVSLNVERHKHLDLVERFFSRLRPDVICLQEVFQHDLERLSEAADAAFCTFEPMGRLPQEPPPGIMGIAILSRAPLRNTQAHYYAGAPRVLKDAIIGNSQTFNNLSKIVLQADIDKDGTVFRVATTHFTWTPDGNPDKFQRVHIVKLLAFLEEIGDFVLCGDFNAPRGGEIFGVLASKYKDNIPPQYKTSLDISLHREGKTKPEELVDKMVDGLFSTPAYIVSDVELISGVSDHCAIVANVSKA